MMDNEDSAKSTRLVNILLCIGLVVGMIALLRPALTDPLTQDEVVTLFSRSSAPYDRTMPSLKKEPAFSPKRIVRGWARSFATPWDPNNHMVNSFALSIVGAFLGYGEFQTRLPSIIGTCTLLLLFFFWTRRITGPWLAFCIVTILATNPYVLYFGARGRGYTITLALLMGLFMSMESTSNDRASRWPYLIRGVLSYALFLNLVSSLTMILVPMYMILWCRLILGCRPELSKHGVRAIVKSDGFGWLAAETIGVGVAILMFLSFNLNAIYRSLGKYGVKIQSWSAAAKLSGAFIDNLFAGWHWKVIACLAVIGGIMAWRKNWRIRFYLPFLLLSFLTSCLFILATGKIGYSRTYGYLILTALVIGVALLRGIQDLSRNKRIIMGILFGLTAMYGVYYGIEHPRTDIGLGEESTRLDQRLCEKTRDNAMVVHPWIYSDVTTLYLSDSGRLNLSEKDSCLLGLFAFEGGGVDRVRTQYAQRNKQEFLYWPIPESWKAGRLGETRGISSYLLDARVYSIDAHIPTVPGLMIWQCSERYFRFGDLIKDKLHEEKAPWDLRMITQGNSLIVFAETESEWGKVRAINADLIKSCSGNGKLVLPSKNIPPLR